MSYIRHLSKNYSIYIFSVLFIVAVVLRISILHHGLPFRYHPDELLFVRIVIDMMSAGDINPHWFNHPASTVIYPLLFAFSALYGVGNLFGYVGSPTAFAAIYFNDPAIFYYLGRFVIFAYFLSSIIVIYSLCLEVYDRKRALLSVFIYSFCPLLIYHSVLIRSADVAMLPFMLAFFLYCARIIRRGNRWDYVWAGFFLGLAIVSKFPAVIFSLAGIAAHIIRYRMAYRKMPLVLLAFAACVFSAFAFAPFLFLDWRDLIAAAAFENRATVAGATGEGFWKNLIWYFETMLWRALTPAGFMFSLLGAAAIAWRRQSDALLIVAVSLCYIVFLSALNLRWERWMIPLVPIFAILAAHGIMTFYETLTIWREGLVSRFAAAFGFGLVAVPMTVSAVVATSHYAGADTRTLARDWIVENVPAGSIVLLERYTPQLPRGRYTLHRVRDGNIVEYDQAATKHSNIIVFGEIGLLADIEQIDRLGVEYVVLSSTAGYERFLKADPTRYATRISMYERLMAKGELIHRVRGRYGRTPGPDISVYRMR